MKEITILSGKGGTGKTTVTAAFASVIQNAVFCDNDVDASDLHLIFKPQIIKKEQFLSTWQLTIDYDKCTSCGLCVQYCRFNAISLNNQNLPIISEFGCEGCRLCERICPSSAISAKLKGDNYWYTSNTRFGSLIHARMSPGEENSGKLVSLVRKKAKEIAQNVNADYLVNDGPPGIGCATIASLSGTNVVLLVVEPTKTALHDAIRLHKLAHGFNIKTYGIINKFDVNTDLTEDIEQYFLNNDIKILARIPFDKDVVNAMIDEKTIVEYKPNSNIANIIKDAWEKLISFEAL